MLRLKEAFSSAEVVEVADTPSKALALLVVCKLLIAMLVALNHLPQLTAKQPVSHN
jgi:hypothetical protein